MLLAACSPPQSPQPQTRALPLHTALSPRFALMDAGARRQRRRSRSVGAAPASTLRLEVRRAAAAAADSKTEGKGRRGETAVAEKSATPRVPKLNLWRLREGPVSSLREFLALSSSAASPSLTRAAVRLSRRIARQGLPQAPATARARVLEPVPLPDTPLVLPLPDSAPWPQRLAAPRVPLQASALAAQRELLLDCETRAAACKRSHLALGEARALAAASVVHDNLGDAEAAVRVLGRARALLALNAGQQEAELDLALASRQAAAACDAGLLAEALAAAEETLRRADTRQRFAAHTSLGVVLARAGRHEDATTQHQLALRCAVLARSARQQTVALANLALLWLRAGDLVSAAACLERGIELTAERGAGEAFQVFALRALGLAALAQRNLGEAEELLSDARLLAARIGDVAAGVADAIAEELASVRYLRAELEDL